MTMIKSVFTAQHIDCSNLSAMDFPLTTGLGWLGVVLGDAGRDERSI